MFCILYFFSLCHLWSIMNMSQAAPDHLNSMDLNMSSDLSKLTDGFNMTSMEDYAGNDFAAEIIDLQPSMTPLLAQDIRPDRFDDFFWSGSGEGEDGVTYWITTTVYRTATVTLTLTYRPSPRYIPNSPTFSSDIPQSSEPEPWLEEDETFVLCSPTPTYSLDIEPTPTFTVTVNSTPVWPTNSSLGSKPTAPSFEYWIRTVVRTNVSEKGSEFQDAIEERLNRMYRHVFTSAIFKSKRETFRNKTKRAGNSVEVMIHNISRPMENTSDVHILYSVYDHNVTRFILATEAVERLHRHISESQITMDLCTHPDANAVDLCKLVLIKAEPYLAPFPQSVSGQISSWLIAVIIIVVVIVVMLLALVGFLLRQNSKKKQRIAQQGLVNRAFQVTTPAGKAEKGTQFSVETPKFKIADSESRDGRFSKGTERPRRGQRPRTAPARKASLSPTGSERTEFRKCCQEPKQPSRGVRGVKRRSRNKRRQAEEAEQFPEHSSESSESSEDPGHRNPAFLQIPEIEVIPSRPTSCRGKHKRVSITNLDVAEPSDTGIQSSPAVTPRTDLTVRPKSGILKVKPGSLIPSRVSSAIFGTRETIQVAGSLRPASAEQIPVTRSPRYLSQTQTAWTTSEPSIVELHSSASQLIDKDDDLEYEVPFIGGGSLHVHAQSYPVWPNLPPTDPAIELINSIKEELKKFDSES